MRTSKGRAEFLSAFDIKNTEESTEAMIFAPEDIQIEIVSASSQGGSKNIQLVFKKVKEKMYCTFEEIVRFGIEPKNITVLMNDRVNELKSGDDSKTGTYYPSGNSTGVEHHFKDSPLFICRNDEYDTNGWFKGKYPNAGFLKVHCKDDFQSTMKLTVSIKDIVKANFLDGTFSR